MTNKRKVKVAFVEENRCHVCGSANMSFSKRELRGGQVVFRYKCKDCLATGQECYNISYAGKKDAAGRELKLGDVTEVPC